LLQPLLLRQTTLVNSPQRSIDPLTRCCPLIIFTPPRLVSTPPRLLNSTLHTLHLKSVFSRYHRLLPHPPHLCICIQLRATIWTPIVLSIAALKPSQDTGAVKDVSAPRHLHHVVDKRLQARRAF
jgi:hypothetical protein